MLSKSAENKLEQGSFYFSFCQSRPFQCPWRWLCPHLWRIRGDVLSPSCGVQKGTRWDAHRTFLSISKSWTISLDHIYWGGVGENQFIFQKPGSSLKQSEAALPFSASPKFFEGKGGVIKVSICLEASDRALSAPHFPGVLGVTKILIHPLLWMVGVLSIESCPGHSHCFEAFQFCAVLFT